MTEARKAEVIPIPDSKVAVVVSAAWGFRRLGAEVAKVIVAYVEKTSAITMAVPIPRRRSRSFGPGGPKNVFPSLLPAGWGGRESIGGSPRGVKMTREQAVETARIIAWLVT